MPGRGSLGNCGRLYNKSSTKKGGDDHEARPLRTCSRWQPGRWGRCWSCWRLPGAGLGLGGEKSAVMALTEEDAQAFADQA